MMVSMAEQRKFLASIHQVDTSRLESIRKDLLEIKRTATDNQFLEKINNELQKRENTSLID